MSAKFASLDLRHDLVLDRRRRERNGAHVVEVEVERHARPVAQRRIAADDRARMHCERMYCKIIVVSRRR